MRVRNAFPLTLPPLHERAEDIPALVEHFSQFPAAIRRLQQTITRARVYSAEVSSWIRMVTTNFEKRRRHPRVPASVPATVTAQGHTLAASTRDVSAGGLFLFTDAPFQKGAAIEVVLMLPRELGLDCGEMVCCQGTVVRVEAEPGHCGIAASIDRIAGLPQL